MKTLTRIVLVAFLALTPSLVSAQTSMPQFRVGTALSAQWDYEHVSTTGATKFFISINGGAYVDTAHPFDTTISTYTHRLMIFPLGTHTVAVKTCLVDVPTDCSAPASMQFRVIGAVPSAPTNLIIVPATTQVTPEQAANLAQAYSMVLRLRPLSDGELMFLVARYTALNLPLTHGSILSFLDQVVSELP